MRRSAIMVDIPGFFEECGKMENKAMSITETLEKVKLALESIKFGEIIIKVQNGKPVFVDKYERERVG